MFQRERSFAFGNLLWAADESRGQEKRGDEEGLIAAEPKMELAKGRQ
jgi:hypothetical protein